MNCKQTLQCSGDLLSSSGGRDCELLPQRAQQKPTATASGESERGSPSCSVPVSSQSIAEGEWGEWGASQVLDSLTRGFGPLQGPCPCLFLPRPNPRCLQNRPQLTYPGDHVDFWVLRLQSKAPGVGLGPDLTQLSDFAREH